MKSLPLLQLLIAICASNIAHAQQPSVPSSGWAAAGPSWNDATSPKFGGWATLALPIGSAWSYTLYQISPIRSKPPVTSMTTGAASQVGSVALGSATGSLFLLGTVGVATSSTATTLAGSLGGNAVLKFKSGLTLNLAWLEAKGPTSLKPEILIGAGYRWGGK